MPKKRVMFISIHYIRCSERDAEYQEAYRTLKEKLGIPEDEAVPPMPREPSTTADSISTENRDEQELAAARAAASYIPFLTPSALLPPKLPTREEMDSVMLTLYKRRLEEEVLG